MMHNEEVENQSLRRRIVLMVMASAFLVWQIPLMDFFSQSTGDYSGISKLVAMAGFVTWATLLVLVLVKGRRAVFQVNPAVTAALEDELVRANRSKAFIIGYGVTVGISAVIFTLSMFRSITGSDAAHIIFVTAVVAPIYAFVVLERINA